MLFFILVNALRYTQDYKKKLSTAGRQTNWSFASLTKELNQGQSGT